MFYRNLAPSEYLAAGDLQGKAVTLTISRLANEEIASERGKQRRWVLCFAELEERAKKDPTKLTTKLVINKTHAKAVAQMHGNETDGWVGKRVQIYPTTCSAFGNPKTPCIRIRSPQEKSE